MNAIPESVCDGVTFCVGQVKEFHPDVYKGPGNADAITQRLIHAYQVTRMCTMMFFVSISFFASAYHKVYMWIYTLAKL
jgi:hypothetical protein